MLIGNERNNLFFVGSGTPDKMRPDTRRLGKKNGRNSNGCGIDNVWKLSYNKSVCSQPDFMCGWRYN